MKSFKEHNQQDEAALVSSDRSIIKSILNRLEGIMVKALEKGDVEMVNNIARVAKLKVTKKGQSKGKAFRYDLKR
tara:strand:- start:1475 stop:1699 length:225 start_codon:yes stop_codon:yes gene_type:complete